MKNKLNALMSFSLNDVEVMHRNGTVDDQLYRAFLAVWTWSAPRMGGIQGMRHDAFWNRCGKARYYARINKVRAAFGFTSVNA